MIPCYLCGSKQISLYLESDKMLQCDSCGLVFLAPEQIPVNLETYYQDNAFYASNSTNPELVKSMAKSATFYLEIISKYLDFGGEKLLVDVGSNYGALVEEAFKRGFKAIGLEKNKSLVEKARQRGLTVLENDLSSLAVPPSVDIITAMHVLEHLNDPRSLVKDAYKKLKSGGLFIIGIPDIESYLAKKDGLSWRYVALEHLFYFSEEVLSRILKEEGFKILTVKKDGTNLGNLSIKKLLHYIAGQPIIRDRFKMKNFEERSSQVILRPNWLKRILKKILILTIKILRREDFIIIIAQKPNP